VTGLTGRGWWCRRTSIPALRPADWATLASSAPRLVVLNIADGPGHLLDGVFAGRRRSGDRGRCHSRWIRGHRLRPQGCSGRAGRAAPVPEWYGVDSVFFDRAASGIEHVARYGRARRRRTGSRVAGWSPSTTAPIRRGIRGALRPAGHVRGTVAVLPRRRGAQLGARSAGGPVLQPDLRGLSHAAAGGIAVMADERNVGSALCTEGEPPNPWSFLPTDLST